MTGFESKRAMAADKLQEPEREALKLALEALQFALHVGFDESSESQIKKGDKAGQQHRNAITAIKEVLAQPVQRTWVGVTDEEIGDAYVAWDDTDGASFADFARDIEQLLKEKNE